MEGLYEVESGHNIGCIIEQLHSVISDLCNYILRSL